MHESRMPGKFRGSNNFASKCLKREIYDEVCVILDFFRDQTLLDLSGFNKGSALFKNWENDRNAILPISDR